MHVLHKHCAHAQVDQYANYTGTETRKLTELSTAHHDRFEVVFDKLLSPVTNVSCAGVFRQYHVLRQRQ